jgi:O-antigen ligase
MLHFFLLSISVSFISNTDISSLLIKLFVSVVLLFTFLFYTKVSGINLAKLFKTFSSKIILFLVGIVLLPTCSLLYSANQHYGIIKILNLVVSFIPLMLVNTLLIALFNESLNRLLKITAMIWSVVIVIMLVILQPININGVYHFSPMHWSHVMVGRVLYFLLLLLLPFFIHAKKGSEKHKLMLCCALLTLGLMMTGLRTAIAGMFLFTPLYLLTGILRKELLWKDAALLLFTLVIACSLSVAMQQHESVKSRLDWVKKMDNGTIKQEGSFKGRIQSLHICMERLREHPIIGIGFGGFYSPWKNYKAWVLKYPHNIFLEYGVEMGCVGLLWLLLMLWLLIKGTWATSPYHTLFFVGAFWLSLFSKDIPSNAILFLGIAFYFVKPRAYYFTES